MTQDQSGRLITMLVTAFSANKTVRELPTETIQLYIAFMATIPFEIGQAATIKLMTNCEFFPTLADIKKAVQSLAPQKYNLPPAEIAWEEVRKKLDPYKSPNWSNAAIERAVKTIGYRYLCDSQNPGADMMRFMKIYDTYRQREVDAVENDGIRKITANIVKSLPGGAA